ncbi:MAG: hypothetical protein K8S24_06390, partial [Candidatus Aegiribacteria sp.]|nr:hypothetical protein [Candidatus Aegiribacteria sp.]
DSYLMIMNNENIDPFHPTLSRNFDVSDPLEWITCVTSHTPRKGAKQVIFLLDTIPSVILSVNVVKS